jgi:hypothetical protein
MESEESLYLALRSSGAFAQAQSLDVQLRAVRARWSTELLWHSPTASAYRVGADLQVLDRELRRAAAIVQGLAGGSPSPEARCPRSRATSRSSRRRPVRSMPCWRPSASSRRSCSLTPSNAFSPRRLSFPRRSASRHGSSAGTATRSARRPRRSSFPGGARATGRRIQFIRTYADGTEDLIVVE